MTLEQAALSDEPALDNWVWHALTGPQSSIAERQGRAARYPIDVSPFAAIDDEAGPEAWEDLTRLVGPGNRVALFRGDLVAPEGWKDLWGATAHQMILPSLDHLITPTGRAPVTLGGPPDDPIAELTVRRLGRMDVEAMLDLVERTKPGPFLSRTVELGTYLGAYDGATLAAMAGERVKVPGWTEISAVCTDPAYRGRGLAAELVIRIASGIFAAGDRPVLHVAVENSGALALYERLGFLHRRTGRVLVTKVPRRP